MGQGHALRITSSSGVKTSHDVLSLTICSHTEPKWTFLTSSWSFLMESQASRNRARDLVSIVEAGSWALIKLVWSNCHSVGLTTWALPRCHYATFGSWWQSDREDESKLVRATFDLLLTGWDTFPSNCLKRFWLFALHTLSVIRPKGSKRCRWMRLTCV